MEKMNDVDFKDTIENVEIYFKNKDDHMKMTIKDRLILFRLSENLNQLNFSKKINISRSTICEIENGKNFLSTSCLIAITKTFDNLNIEWLITGNGKMLKYEFIDSTEIFELIQTCNNKQRQELHKMIKDKIYIDKLDEINQLS
jgi:transcriptional regulator with XRE-family HTH domain